MADKLSWTELRRAIAVRAGVSEKEANLFLNALNRQLIEALKQDKQVKINGLGTFRLQPVASRKSVNVSTGEEITIEGYNKIVFNPEAGVKELIENNGKAVSAGITAEAAAEEINPLKKLGEQAEEIVDILADLGQSPDKPKEEKATEKAAPKKRSKKAEAKVTADAEAAAVAEAVPVAETPVEETPVVAPVQEEPVPTKAPIAETAPIAAPVKEEPKEEKPKKKYHFLRDTLICVVCLLLLLLIGYFFLRNHLSSWIESYLQKDPAATEQVSQGENSSSVSAPAAHVPSDTLAAEISSEEPAAAGDDQAEASAIEEIRYERMITTEPMHEASRLTWMSKRYYGDKKYWPYLYDANKDRIDNPNHIKVGTPIRVPDLTAEQKDTTIEQTRLTLERLRQQAEAACRK